MLSSSFDMENLGDACDAVFALICANKVGSHVVWFPGQKMAWERPKGVCIRVVHYNLH